LVSDQTNTLRTAEEFHQGYHEVAGVDENGAEQDNRVNLMNAEKKLYEDNAMALNKISSCVSDEMLVPMIVEAGAKKLVYKVKQWLEKTTLKFGLRIPSRTCRRDSMICTQVTLKMLYSTLCNWRMSMHT